MNHWSVRSVPLVGMLIISMVWLSSGSVVRSALDTILNGEPEDVVLSQKSTSSSLTFTSKSGSCG